MNAQITGKLMSVTVETFKDSDGNDREWTNCVLMDNNGNPFSFSLDVETGAELIKQADKVSGKAVKVTGVLRRYRGVLKFKGMSVEIL